MSKLIFLLILFVFVLILSATPLFRKSRSQREYESSGMQLLATSRGRVLLLPALGCLCACIVTFFMVLMYQDIGFEASDIGYRLSALMHRRHHPVSCRLLSRRLRHAGTSCSI